MKLELIKKYAEFIVKTGAAVKPGQYVIIRTTPEQENFAALVAEECYKAGAKRVVLNWGSQKIDKIAYKYASAEDLGRTTASDYGWQLFQSEDLPSIIFLDAEDPDGLKGVDANKMAQVRARRYNFCKDLIEERENKYVWTIAGVPSLAWAAKVFPDDTIDVALDKLWEAVLKTARADDGNGIENWNKHEKNLKERCATLNSLNLRKLKYSAENGTDFEVGLIPGVVFQGGGELTLDGQFFQPNIPSEECFTTPMKGKAEGIVYASKPLAYNGQLIDKFWLKFHEGKVVDCGAEKGEEVLKSILTLDEGASYLGEVALVPFESPINQTGLIFYNTLFDENACCHLAIGRGFPELYPNYEKYTRQELLEKGINHSLSHVDFMIGTRDLKIVGTDKFGKEIVIFENGTWAI